MSLSIVVSLVFRKDESSKHLLVAAEDGNVTGILLIWISVLLQIARIRNSESNARGYSQESTYNSIMLCQFMLLFQRDVLGSEEHYASLHRYQSVLERFSPTTWDYQPRQPAMQAHPSVFH